MIAVSAALLLLSAAGGGAGASEATRYAQLIVREQIVIRSRRKAPEAPPKPVDWKERKGPKCLSARAIAGAGMMSANSVDLMLRSGERMRARLQRSCPALDYYYGFYISPGADGRICADRDSIRSRVGGRCEIEAFRTLTPKSGKK